MSNENKKINEADMIRIENLATKLADIAHVLEMEPMTRMSAMAIAVGITAASLGFKKDEIIELVSFYFEKTDKVLTQLEESLKLSSNDDKPRVIKTDTLN